VSTVFVCGESAISPAGWGMAVFRGALARGEPLPTKELARPGLTRSLQIRSVPPPSSRPAFAGHARLRRTSPIAHYAVAAALEALGSDAAKLADGRLRLGIVLCVMSGCVNYSRRFYDETLKDPATASPLVFPETVFNAPASHLAALLGTTAINYTLVGDPATVLQGIALAADWLLSDQVDGCLVIGAEEMDWLTAEAVTLFASQARMSDGAGALYLRREPGEIPAIELRTVTDPHLFSRNQSRAQAAQHARAQLSLDGSHQLLCDGLQGVPVLDKDEAAAWADWPGTRLSVKKILGEGLMAAAAWQCVAAVDALRHNSFSTAIVSIVGCNQQAIAAQFARSE
jgi:3-oxoacyl-(acyl-carrier-protein) synthase